MGSSASRSSSRISNHPSETSSKSLLEKKESKIKQQAKQLKELKKENESLKEQIEELEKKLDKHDDVAAFLENSSPEKPLKNEKVKDENDRNLPQIGDHVVSMWSSSQWQYFTATVRSFNKETLRYEIDWDDNDPTGRVVDYFNLALDKVPSIDSVGINSTVMFHQGKYVSTQIQGVTRSGGLRWHQGIIENVTTSPDGKKLYSGRHTKSDQDGKWISYKDYSATFSNYTIEDFRMPPNVFDVLDLGKDDDSDSSDDEAEHYDVYMSYSKINSPMAIRNNEVGDLPPSYEEAVLSDLCDPRAIRDKLREKGVKVAMIEEEEYLKIVTTLKRSKIFIACLSDEYASNNRCRMEFQYAKKTLKIPVLPIVVGTNSFQWKMTVVGLLIAGDLYIHFKNKEVEETKMTELCRALQNHLPRLKISNVQHLATGEATMDLHAGQNTITGKPAEEGPSNAEMFFSYCWLNSHDAYKRKQVSKLNGSRWNDPRVILKKLSKATGMKSWMDVDRLQGADEMGLFGQIATGMSKSKIVISCVSMEYANSDNCRMEVQFAVKSLSKPTIALIVGDSDSWRETSVGKLASKELTIFDLQAIKDEKSLDSIVVEIRNSIAEKMGTDAPTYETPISDAQEGEIMFKAPVYGDHVVCLHQGWAYFAATVVAFDESRMQYTVDWDDGDPSGRVQSYQDVALDVVPLSENDIGIGTVVLFPQGSYAGTEGNNSGGVRYHQGKVTKVHQDSSGRARYDGVHTKDQTDGKWVTYRGYEKSFSDITIDELRLSPNAMDALMACRQAFHLK